MNLTLLSSSTMISLTAAWLDPARDRPVLAKLPHCAPLLPDVQAAHDSLMKANSKVQLASPELQGLVAECAALDAKHDRKLRGIRSVLDGLALLSDDPNDARAYEALRDEVSGPLGAGAIHASFLEEGTNATGTDKRLTKKSKTLAKATGAGAKTIDKWIKDWRGVAEALVEASTSKRAVSGASEGAAPGELLQARNAWVRAVGDVLKMMDRDDPDRAVRQRLTSPLAVEVAKAEAAIAAKKKKKGKKDKGGGASDGGATPAAT